MCSPTSSEVVDLVGRNLRILDKCPEGVNNVNILLVDDNHLQRLENVESYGSLIKLSAGSNELLYMHNVAKLHQLRVLNLPRNNITCIDGLRELHNLTWLNLAENRIKLVEHLHNNIALEHLDLSGNQIERISDLSHLKNLQKLYLHRNRISTLKFCNNFIPSALISITLAENHLDDLTELCYLSHLTRLQTLSVCGNPWMPLSGCDYRPFIVNWCLSLRVLDGYVVTPKESLRAEWLYSQGRGRHFRPGEHRALMIYLIQINTSADDIGVNDEDKLNKILGKAKEHQQSLESSPSSSRPGSGGNKFRSPMMRYSSMNTDSAYNIELPANLYGEGNFDMSRSLDCTAVERQELLPASSDPFLSMSQSLDPTMLCGEHNKVVENGTTISRPPSLFRINKQNSTDDLVVRDISYDGIGSSSCMPLESATKFVPVPETMMSPDFCPVPTSVPPCVSSLHKSPAALEKSNIAKSTSSPSNSPIRRKSTPSPNNLEKTHCATRICGKPIFSSENTSKMGKSLSPRVSQSPSTSPNAARRRVSPSFDRRANTPRNDPIAADVIQKSKLENICKVAEERKQHLRTSNNCVNVTLTEPSPNKETSEDLVTSTHSGSTDQEQDKPPSAPPELSKSSLEAVITIQRLWRGYKTRNLDAKVVKIRDGIRIARAEEYIRHLVGELDVAKAELANEKKIRRLQMDAIKAIWRERQSGNPSSLLMPMLESHKGCEQRFDTLSQTTSDLQSQVRLLQDSLQHVLHCLPYIAYASSITTATVQTVITAVDTPRDEKFPFGSCDALRPSTLPIYKRRYKKSASVPRELARFASDLVDTTIRGAIYIDTSNSGGRKSTRSAPTSTTEIKTIEFSDLETNIQL